MANIAEQLNNLSENIVVINNAIENQEEVIADIMSALEGKGISNAKATFSYTNNHATFLAPSTFYECDAFHELILPVAGSVAESAFAYCNNLETVRMPVCGSLDGSAFINCTNLKEVEIPMCDSINDSTFEGCENLTTLILGSQCTYIGNNAFNGCGNLTTFAAPDCS
jgi:hypothetical protein